MNKKRIYVLICAAYILMSGVVGHLISKAKVDHLMSLSESYQISILDYIKIYFEDLSDEDMENVEELDRIFNLFDSYGFVYRDNVIIYERNLETTSDYRNATARELFNDYFLENGENTVESANDIMLSDEGTAFVTKDDADGEEIISWCNIEKNGSNYIVGVGMPVDDIIESVQYNKFKKVGVAVFVINVCVVAALCFFGAKAGCKRKTKN